MAMAGLANASAEYSEVEVEEGECSSDSNGEPEQESMVANTAAVPDKAYSVIMSPYQPPIPQIVINSDDSSGESDDDCPSQMKKSRNPKTKPHGSNQINVDNRGVPFFNPLLNSQSSTLNQTQSFLVSNNRSKAKGRNNIWGSVLTEQVLSQDMQSFMVEKVDKSNFRDVESYDFKRAHHDDRPSVEIGSDECDNAKDDPFCEIVDLEKEVKIHESRKRKRKAKERLGRRSYKFKPRNLVVTEDSTVKEVVSDITSSLKEENIALFTRIIETIGQKLAIRLYYMTEDVEEAGGMMVNNGRRRRTPGGVYIQLLKSESLVSEEKITVIFQQDKDRWKALQKEERKIKKATKKKWKNQQMQQVRSRMDIDRPETPTPTDDLEVLSAADSNNEFDNTDLPERPATPEPKDDSSDGEEEEEEEDISVAIAKAKAALLERQRELAKNSQQAGEILASVKDIKDLSYDVPSSDVLALCDNDNMEDA